MAIKVRSYAVVAGQSQALELARGEDCDLRFVFAQPATSPGAGDPVDLTGARRVRLRARADSGALLVDVSGAIAGSPTLGQVDFVASLGAVREQVAVADVTWTDADGNREQLLAASPLVVRG